MSDQVPAGGGSPGSLVAGSFTSVAISGTGIILGTGGSVTIQANNAGTPINAGQFDFDDTANSTRFLIGRGGGVGLQRVTLGAIDSGGVGFRLLRVVN